MILPKPALSKSAANLKGSTDRKRTGMEISKIFHEMSKPNYEKYITVFKYFCNFFFGLRQCMYTHMYAGRVTTRALRFFFICYNIQE